MQARLLAAVAALCCGLVSGATAAEPAAFALRCRSWDGLLTMAARDAPPSLLLFDAQGQILRTWPVASRDGRVASRVAAIADAPARRSFVVALGDLAEIWEISYDPRAEDFYEGLVHDFRMGEGVPTRGYLNPRRTPTGEPLQSLAIDATTTEALGTAGDKLLRINLDVRRTIGRVPLAAAPPSAKSGQACR